MMKTFAVLFLSLFTLTFAAYADLEVTGIMPGEKPVAVVDGKVVKLGDKIGGYTVQEINAGSVKFRAENGSDLSKKLGAEHKAKAETAPQPPEKRAAGNPVQADISDNIRRSQDYARQADDLLSEQKVMSVGKYNEALSLYDKSERELQYALEKTADHEDKQKISASIKIVRDGHDAVSMKKRSLEKEIENAVRSRKAVLGMTRADVVNSMGSPEKKNQADYQGSSEEQWIYGDPMDGGKLLYFNDGIVTSTQF
jgi:hypothetical protein